MHVILKCIHDKVVLRCRCPGPHKVETVACPPTCSHLPDYRPAASPRLKDRLPFDAELESTAAYYERMRASDEELQDLLRAAATNPQGMVAVNAQLLRWAVGELQSWRRTQSTN